MLIFIDKDNKCHTEAAEGLTAVETPFFDGKCKSFIEGYKYDTEKKMISPWKDYNILAAYQEQYEAMLAEQMDMQTALELLEVRADG